MLKLLESITHYESKKIIFLILRSNLLAWSNIVAGELTFFRFHYDQVKDFQVRWFLFLKSIIKTNGPPQKFHEIDHGYKKCDSVKYSTPIWPEKSKYYEDIT